jgi:hypothetical protein
MRMLRDCGHWTRQQRPGEVSAAMIDFLAGLPTSRRFRATSKKCSGMSPFAT